jgi:hypothetical protein
VTPPAASQAHAAPPLAPRRRAAPSGPRRVSGPSRAPARTAPRPASAERGLVPAILRLLGRFDALASHRMVDRAIRSRVWIGIVAFALIGIVTLQLGLLKLNAGIGRALEREAVLQRDNAALSVENSELQTGSRVETEAGQLGMRLASIAGLKFLGSHAHGDISKAAAALRAAPAREAAATQSEVAAADAESESAPSGSGEGEQAEGQSTSGESEAAGGEAAASAPASEASESSASSGGGTAEGEGEASSALPAGEGGGAAAPGG